MIRGEVEPVEQRDRAGVAAGVQPVAEAGDEAFLGENAPAGSLGAEMFDRKSRPMGFGGSSAADETAQQTRAENSAADAAKRSLPPELWNRIDERLVFRPLRGHSPAVMLVATFAVAFVLQNVALIAFGSLGKTAGQFGQLQPPRSKSIFCHRRVSSGGMRAS